MLLMFVPDISAFLEPEFEFTKLFLCVAILITGGKNCW